RQVGGTVRSLPVTARRRLRQSVRNTTPRYVVSKMRPRASAHEVVIGMKWQTIATVVAGTLVLSACAVSSTSGSGQAVNTSSSEAATTSPSEAGSTGAGGVRTESRQVSGFTAVELQGFGDLTIEQTGAESLTIEAEDDIL